MTPAWISDLLAALMLVVAAVSAVRLVAARPWRPGSVIIDTDIAHLLMAIAMAGVLTSSLSTLPDTAWEVIFGVMIAWFAFRVVLDARANGLRALAGGHCAPHLAHSGAMLYMFLAMTATSGAMAGMVMPAGSSSLMLSDPTLAFVFTVILIGYSVWDLDQLSSRRYGLTSARVSLAGVRAAVPAMAGAETVTASFSGPRHAGTVLDPVTGSGADGSGPGGSRPHGSRPHGNRPGGNRPHDSRPDGGHVVSCGDDTIGGGTVAGGALGEFLLSPAVTIGCRITMSVAMVFMLLIAI
jgi:hypothetical protein